jgi:hypothetical protein
MDYWLTGISFRLAGLKYQDIKVRISNNRDGKISLAGSPATIWENTAPDMAKKKPAYAHSFNNVNLGISNTITPNIFQVLNKVRENSG